MAFDSCPPCQSLGANPRIESKAFTQAFAHYSSTQSSPATDDRLDIRPPTRACAYSPDCAVRAGEDCTLGPPGVAEMRNRKVRRERGTPLSVLAARSSILPTVPMRRARGYCNRNIVCSTSDPADPPGCVVCVITRLASNPSQMQIESHPTTFYSNKTIVQRSCDTNIRLQYFTVSNNMYVCTASNHHATMSQVRYL